MMVFRRLKEYKDTAKLLIFTLDLASHNYPIITAVDGLPFDCISLLPCSTVIGGVVVLTSNSIIYVDQSSRRVPLPVNGWPPRLSDLPMPVLPAEEQRNLELEGCRSAFVDDRTIFVVLRDGTVYPIEVVVDGKTVSKLSMAPALVQTTIPSVLKKVDDDYFFVGSAVGPSVLLKTLRVEEELSVDDPSNISPTAVVDIEDGMELDDDDGEFFYRHADIELKSFQKSTAHRNFLLTFPVRASTVGTALSKRYAVLCIFRCVTLCLHMVRSLIWHFRWRRTEYVFDSSPLYPKP